MRVRVRVDRKDRPFKELILVPRFEKIPKHGNQI